MLVPHQPSFNLHPLALLAASFAAGILLARLISPPLAACFAGGIILSTLAVVACLRERAGHATVLVVAAFAACGAVFASAEGVATPRVPRVRQLLEEGRIGGGDPVELTGVLERAPEVAPDGLALRLRAERWGFKGEEREVSGAVELFAPARSEKVWAEYDALELRRGARLRVLVGLDRDEGYRNPGVSPFTEYLERRDADARGTIKSPLVVERLDDEPVFLPLLWLERRRAWLLARFTDNFSADTAGVLAASVLGNRLHLARATGEKFREGGTFHVLVISGLHITFVGGVAWWLARRLTRRRLWQWAASAVCVWAYAVAVGAEASVLRAALMFTVAALAPAIGRPAGTLNALGGAALALLAARPRALFDPSFQLTFLSVLSIVVLAWPALTRLHEVGAWRPRSTTPYPPACPALLRRLAEALYWSERRWRREMRRSTYSYRLFKTPLAARLERWRVQAALRYVFTAVLVSACVQTGMLPALVLYFHRLTPAALVLNVFVGALMAVLSFAALAAVLVAQVSAKAAAPLVWLAEWANRLMVDSAGPFAAAGLASVRLPEYAGAAAFVYALYYLPLAVLALSLAHWSPLALRVEAETAAAVAGRRLLKVSAWLYALLVAVIIFHPFSAGRAEGRLRIDFLDVGQGDAALLTMPDGTTLLVDGGGRPGFNRRREGDAEAGRENFERDTRGVGEAVVSEYLWWRGLDRVDYLLSTHADADHIDGLNDIARNFRVGAALVARTPAGDSEFARFTETLRRASVPLYVVGRGDRLRFGSVEVDVLWPPVIAPGDRATSGNNDSVVLRVRVGRRTFLLTGDIEAGAEAALVAASPGGLGSDAVKVAHHGSRTSSTEAFVAATRPTFAVISVARDSPYGHPHESVVERWHAHGAQVLTTGERGMITVSTDGADLKVETFVKP
ncbi:MAG TPA: ComEC/Rec2 family competence protein [Pyrinomonadaceae bacterium]